MAEITTRSPTARSPGARFPSKAVCTNNDIDFILNTVLPAMCSTRALDRAQSEQAFSTALPTLSGDNLKRLTDTISVRLSMKAETWQQVAGVLISAKHTISQRDDVSQHFVDDAKEAALLAIPYPEARVRTVASALLGAVARSLGEPAWDCCRVLLNHISSSFDIAEETRLEEAARIAGRDVDGRAEDTKLNAVHMVHETEGWRGLETALLALEQVVRACGQHVLHADDYKNLPHMPDIIHYIVRAKEHQNRFVREAGLRLLTAVLGHASTGLVRALTDHIVPVISQGLEDNWSQVRYSASIAVRSMLTSVDQDTRRLFYPRLLPRMCLNRHYVAEGVRVYSQQTWRNVIGEDGRIYLLRLLPEVVAFYESQCVADNHAVREASCQSIGELALRLEHKAISAFVPNLIKSLIVCFKDESWPVRDNACCALADVIHSFGQAVESTGQLEELYDLFHAHLADNIPSVRENCATAIVHASKAYPKLHPILGLNRLSEDAMTLVACIEKQEECSYGSSARDRDTGYGAASKVARDNDIDLHTGQVMYSCGSLAPKLRRGGGCMDHGFSRPREPWEEMDGGIRLWRRIADVQGDGIGIAQEAMPQIVSTIEIACLKEFGHKAQLMESVWTQFAAALLNLSTCACTEEHVVNIARLVERDRKSENARVSAAAAAAARALRRSLGLKRYAEIECKIRL